MEKDSKPLFVIDTNPAVNWPVTVKLPADGGTFVEYQFTARIRVLAEADYAALAPVATNTPDVIVPAAPTWHEILADNARQFASLVVGWEGPTDTEGNPVPFTPEALKSQVLGPRGKELSAGLWQAISEVRFGARLKNSEPLPAAG